MKLSDECATLDLPGRAELIEKIKALEELASNWDLLEKLPHAVALMHHCENCWSIRNNGGKSMYPSLDRYEFTMDTAADALKAYWDGKK